MSDSIVHTGTAIGWYRCDGKDCPVCGTSKPAVVSAPAQDEVDLLNDDYEGEKEYRVVPLYREPGRR